MARIGGVNGCLWLAAIASWPNPESAAGQERAERCYDKWSRTAGPSGSINRLRSERPAWVNNIWYGTPDVAKANTDQLAIIAIAVLALVFIWKKA